MSANLRDARVLVLNEKDRPQALLIGNFEVLFINSDQVDRLMKQGYERIPAPELNKWIEPGGSISILRKPGGSISILRKPEVPSIYLYEQVLN